MALTNPWFKDQNLVSKGEKNKPYGRRREEEEEKEKRKKKGDQAKRYGN